MWQQAPPHTLDSCLKILLKCLFFCLEKTLGKNRTDTDNDSDMSMCNAFFMSIRPVVSQFLTYFHFLFR